MSFPKLFKIAIMALMVFFVTSCSFVTYSDVDNVNVTANKTYENFQTNRGIISCIQFETYNFYTGYDCDWDSFQAGSSDNSLAKLATSYVNMGDKKVYCVQFETYNLYVGYDCDHAGMSASPL